MGYTHHWRQPRPFTESEWALICGEAQRVFAAAKAKGIALGDGGGEGEPEIRDDAIVFNGAGPKGSYETFGLEKAPAAQPWREGEPPYNFCKTARRPYDAVVVSILAAAALIAPDAITPTSDGGAEAIKLMF